MHARCLFSSGVYRSVGVSSPVGAGGPSELRVRLPGLRRAPTHLASPTARRVGTPKRMSPSVAAGDMHGPPDDVPRGEPGGPPRSWWYQISPMRTAAVLIEFDVLPVDTCAVPFHSGPAD